MDASDLPVESAPEVLSLLHRAVEQTRDILAGIEPRQLGWPTPCLQWDVGTLLGHVVGSDLPNFVAGVRGGAPNWAAAPPRLEAGWLEDFDASAAELTEVWAAADVGQQITGPGGAQVPLLSRADQQITELAVHAWDLALATEQAPAFDSQVGEYALAWGMSNLKPEYRGSDKAFGEEVAVPQNSAVYDRLAGWFGRDPRWSLTPEL